jgi:hypothetical protein
MNPCDKEMMNYDKMDWQLTVEERRQREVKVQVAVNRLERMEHHTPPRKGEHCYFNSGRDRAMSGMTPAARYICVTSTSQSCGVDFSVEEPVDTKYSHYHYHGKLVSITVDHGMGKLWRQRIS